MFAPSAEDLRTVNDEDKPTRDVGGLAEHIRRVVVEAGASFLGVADMAVIQKAAARLQLPKDHWSRGANARLPRVISVGVPVDDSLCDSLVTAPPGKEPPPIQTRYSHHGYVELWPTALAICAKIGEELRNLGYNAAGRICPKAAARFAGLGWIGKSSLLVTPGHGPRVWWESILTDAPLEPTATKPMKRRCGECTRCIDVCPVQAYKDVPFVESDPLMARYDSGKCLQFRKSQGKGANVIEEINSHPCALCVRVCPYGQRNAELLVEPGIRLNEWSPANE